MNLGNKILIWGNGEIGQQVKSVLATRGENIVGIVDKKQEKIDLAHKLYPIKEGLKLDFDQIVIAVGSEDCGREVTELVKKYRGTSDMNILNIMYQPQYYELFEGGRHKFLKQFADEAKKRGLFGAVAECGVNHGEFAKYINMYFPDSVCYLFDTFEGFSSEDVTAEIELNNQKFNDSVYAKEGVFSQASEENVMKKMKYPEKVLIRKGHFPETAEGIKDKFLYVNLDMDLYQPELAGLRFFWDKMVSGGLIMLHDYTHPELPGVKKAVDVFLAENKEDISVQVVANDCSCAIFKP